MKSRIFKIIKFNDSLLERLLYFVLVFCTIGIFFLDQYWINVLIVPVLCGFLLLLSINYLLAFFGVVISRNDSSARIYLFLFAIILLVIVAYFIYTWPSR